MLQSPPDLMWIDPLLLAYRLGHVRSDEEKTALLAAARAATDAIGYMTAVVNFGVPERSRLHQLLGKIVAAPAYYRAQYPTILGLHQKDEPVESFLGNMRVLSLVEAVLTFQQQQLFYDAYWWFVHNHQPLVIDAKKMQRIGLYADEPKDNASTVIRFQEYLTQLMNHRNKTMRDRFKPFPADIVMAILKRAFS